MNIVLILSTATILGAALVLCWRSGKGQRTDGRPAGIGGWLMALLLYIGASLAYFLYIKADQARLLWIDDYGMAGHATLVMLLIDPNWVSLMMGIAAIVLMLRRDSWAPDVVLAFLVTDAMQALLTFVSVVLFSPGDPTMAIWTMLVGTGALKLAALIVIAPYLYRSARVAGTFAVGRP